MADISDAEDIAGRIVNIIESPNTIKGMINGALTVPLDFGYLALGYFDTDSRYDHQTQRIRMLTAIRHDILNYDHIVDTIHIGVTQSKPAFHKVISAVSKKRNVLH